MIYVLVAQKVQKSTKKYKKVQKSTKKFKKVPWIIFNLNWYLKLVFNGAEQNRFDMPGWSYFSDKSTNDFWEEKR